MNFKDFLGKETSLMPALFVGHGSPMNAIEVNEFSNRWKELGTSLPKPNAILCISAHWETRGTFVTGMESPKTIHDFYGFPPELYSVEYKAEGNPELASSISKTIEPIGLDAQWGLDHGCWSILEHLYPKADIPVVQLSIDYTKSLKYHFDLAKELSALRKKGVLIIGSGNIVHNLRMMSIKNNDMNAEYGYDWASEINQIIKSKIVDKDVQSLVEYQKLSKDYRLAIPSLEHYIPMIYTLGAEEKDDNIHFFNDKLIAGSLSMTSFIVS